MTPSKRSGFSADATKMTSTASRRTVMHQTRRAPQVLRALLVAFLAVIVVHPATFTSVPADPAFALSSATHPPRKERVAFDAPTPDALAARNPARWHASASAERDTDTHPADPARAPGADHAHVLAPLGSADVGDSPSIAPAFLPSVQGRAPPVQR